MNKNDNIPKHKMCNLYFILKSFLLKTITSREALWGMLGFVELSWIWSGWWPDPKWYCVVFNGRFFKA